MMFSNSQLIEILSESLGDDLNRLILSSVTANNFAFYPERLSPSVLSRHAAEHVFRIRALRSLDSDATHRLEADLNPTAALWAKYARSEAVHDRYFLRDLDTIGLTRDLLEALVPFAATTRLVSFLAAAMAEYGALPVVLYSFWAEQNSDVGSAPIIDSVQSTFGVAAARGAAAHRRLDDTQDHLELVVDVARSLINSQQELQLAVSLLDEISDLLGEYFAELDVWSRSPDTGILFKRAVAGTTLQPSS